MSPRHPLSGSHQPDSGWHWWGGLLLVVLLIVSIRWSGRTPVPGQANPAGVTSPPVVSLPQTVPETTLPRVSEPVPVAPSPESKPPVVTPAQFAGPNPVPVPRQLPAWWSATVPTPPVNAIAVAPDGVVWAATEGGLVRLQGDAFALLSRRSGTWPADAATALAHDGTALWIGSGEGLWRTTDGASFQRFAKADGLINDMVWSLDWDGLVLWIGTQAGFSFRAPDGRIDGVDKKVSNGGLADIWIGSLRRFGKWMLCGNDDGLSIWDTGVYAANPAGWQTLDMFATNLPHNWILAMTVFQDAIWVGTPKGLARLQVPPAEIFAGRTPSWDVYDQRRGLPSDRVNALAGTRDALWVGTANGLCRLRGGSLRQVMPADGLLATDVRALAVASDTLWIGTGAGLQSLNLTRFE